MPDNFWDGLGVDPGPGPKAKVAQKPEKFWDGLEANPGLSNNVTNTNTGEFWDYMPKTGVHEGTDLQLRRAQNQGWGEQLGKTIGNTVANIPLDIVQGLGYTAELLTGDHDYTNGLVDTIDKWKDPFGELYREHPDKTFDLGDSAWWMQNIGGFAEGVAQFAIPAVGEGALFGAAAKSLSSLFKMGAEGEKLLMAGAHGLTSSHLAYLMAAPEGKRVYEQAYQANYDRFTKAGDDPVTADNKSKKLASEGAAHTVRVATTLNSIMGLAAIAPMFRNGENKIQQWIENNAGRAEGETDAAWKDRINNAVQNNPELQDALKHRPSSGVTSHLNNTWNMGVQMVNNEYARKSGMEVGTDKAKSSVNAISDYLDKVTDQEGALSFITGLILGPAHTMLVDHLPVHQLVKFDSEGNPMYKQDPRITDDKKFQMSLVSAKTRDEFHNAQYFSNAKDAIIKDIDWYSGKKQDLKKAIDANDNVKANQLREQMFGVHNLNAIMTGTGDAWKNEYQAIADLSPQEAVQKGYAADENDKEYKQRATQAVEDLGWMKKSYDDLHSNYVSQLNPHSEQLAQHIFARTVEQKLNKRVLDKEEQSLAQDESFVQTLTGYNARISLANRIADGLNADRSNLIEAADQNNIKELKRLSEKYSLPVHDDAGLPKAIERLTDVLKTRIDKHKSVVDHAKEDLHNESGYNEWKDKHPGKSFDEYLDLTGEEHPIDARFMERKAALDKYREEWDISQHNLETVKTRKGVQDFLDAAAKHEKNEKKDIEAKNMSDNIEAFKRLSDKQSAAKLDTKQKLVVAKQLHDEIRQNIKEKNSIKDLLDKAQGHLDELNSKKNFKAIIQRREVRRQIENLKAQLDMLDTHRHLVEHQLSLIDQKVGDSLTQEATADSTTRDEVTAPPTTESSVSNVTDIPQTTAEPVTDTTHPQADNSDPIDSYIALTDQMPGEVLNVLDNAETMQRGRMEDGKSFSYDLTYKSFQKLIADQVISRDTAHELTIKQKEYLQKDVADKAKRVDTTKETVPAEMKSPDVSAEDISAPEESFTPIINGAPTPDQIQSDEKAVHISDKSFSSMKVNSASIQYMQISHTKSRINPKTGKKEDITTHSFIPLYDKLDENANHNVLKPGFVQTGDALEFRVDNKFKGQVNYDKMSVNDDFGMPQKRDETFADHATTDDKILMTEGDGYGNVPISIVHSKSGEVIGYLPRADWVTAQYTGSRNWRNIEDNITTEDGEVISGNVEAQKNLLLAVRKRIALAHNEGRGQTIKTTVTDRDSAGHMFYNTDVNKNSEKSALKPLLAKNLLPDTALQYGMINNGTVFIGHNTPIEGDKNFDEDSLNRRFGKPGKPASNIPVVILPMPNDKVSVSPLYTRSLSERPADINTIARAIEAYLASGTDSVTDVHSKVIDAIYKATAHEGTHRGLDITSEKDLETFINQYFTYTQHFNEVHTKADAAVLPGAKKTPRFMLDIPTRFSGENKSKIKVGTTFSGTTPIYASLVDGKLHPDFEEALTEGLASHYKNVVYTRGDIRGLNDKRPLNSIIIRKDGTPRIDKHTNYNEYLKSFADTIIYGKHKIGSDGKEVDEKGKGTYVYGANPVINFDFNQIDSTRIVTSQTESSPANLKDTKAEPESPEFIDIHELLRNGALNPDSSGEVHNSTGTIADSKPATIENLYNLHKDTPAEKHNGQSPEKALEEMHALGITDISPRFNPFLKC